MRELGRQKLRNYPEQFPMRHHSYYYCPNDLDWRLKKAGKNLGSPYFHWRKKLNLGIPPHLPLTPIVNLDGSPFLVEKIVYVTGNDPQVRKIRRKGLLKKVQKRMSYDEQLLKSYDILDQLIPMLELHSANLSDDEAEVHGPLDWLHCRYDLSQIGVLCYDIYILF